MTRPEYCLWRSVLARALLDLNEPDYRDAAIFWLTGLEIGVGSFQWICHILDIDYELAQKAVQRYINQSELEFKLYA